MKNMRILGLLVMLSMATFVKAQVSTFGVNYVIGLPMGNTGDFIKDPSYRGASFEYTYVPDDHFGIHFEGGWNYFYQKIDKTTYEYKTLSITGTQYRYVESVPLFVGMNYFIMPEAVVKPYVAFGAGVMYNEQWNDVGLYRIGNTSWQFGIKPELGVAFALNENVLFKFSGKYYQSFKTDRLDAQSFLGINMGFAFKVE
jgi:opacity protein-like surface antigen